MGKHSKKRCAFLQAERLAQMEGGGGSKKKKKREKKKDTDVSVKTSWFDNHFEDYADGIHFYFPIIIKCARFRL